MAIKQHNFFWEFRCELGRILFSHYTASYG